MKRTIVSTLLSLSLAALAPLFSHAQIAVTPPAATEPDAAPAGPLCKYVVVISIDGCRPDILLRANTPTIHDMIKRGSYTFYAQTTDVAITLPSHFSMLTGVIPEKHGVNFNDDPPDDKPITYKVPTLFDLAHAHGLSTAISSTKSKFEVFTRKGGVDYAAISADSSDPNDLLAGKNAAFFVTLLQPRVMLLHMGGNDKAGHAKGWGSPEQFKALESADAGIKLLFDALKQAGTEDQTLVILSADHGGSSTKHGANDPRSRFIPWIAVGPNVKKGYDLTNDRERTIRTEDTFATAAFFLNLPLPPSLEGRPIKQIIPKRNLMK